MSVTIPSSPGQLYNEDNSYKFTETPTPTPSEGAERSSKMFFTKKSSSPKEQAPIWPPQAKLRGASSMLTLNANESDSTQISNQFSQSSFYLNQEISNDVRSEDLKKKRKKWYKMFMPPKEDKVTKFKTFEEITEVKELKNKRPWYKKKKKDNSKEKIAIAC